MTNVLAGRRLCWALGFTLLLAAMLLLWSSFGASGAAAAARGQVPPVFGICLQEACGVLDSNGKVGAHSATSTKALRRLAKGTCCSPVAIARGA